MHARELVNQYVWGPTHILVEKWLEKFNEVDNRCIEIVEGSGEVFSQMYVTVFFVSFHAAYWTLTM